MKNGTSKQYKLIYLLPKNKTNNIFFREQKELSTKIKEYDDFDWSLSTLKYVKPLKKI